MQLLNLIIEDAVKLVNLLQDKITRAVAFLKRTCYRPAFESTKNDVERKRFNTSRSDQIKLHVFDIRKNLRDTRGSKDISSFYRNIPYQPFQEIIVRISREKYVTGSEVIIF